VSVHIRPAGPLDLKVIEAIENEADRLLIERLHPDRWEPAPAGASRASEHGYLLVAEVDPRTLVGFVHVLEAEGLAHLEQLSVLPEHGRRGYGRMLVGAAKDEARQRGYAWLTLRTYADVPWNAPFYARAGFVEEDAATPFHRRLIDTEVRLGLDRYGRRIQMATPLR
jgi:GNAT superfamily N-acetyltransferase